MVGRFRAWRQVNRERGSLALGTAGLVLLGGCEWLTVLFPARQQLLFPLVFFFFPLALWLVLAAGAYATRKATPLDLALSVLAVVNYLVVLFTFAYYQAGSGKNFSIPLSHLDAIALAVGTLTTAGSSIVPTSEYARGLVALQEGVDFIALGVVVAYGAALVAERVRQP